MENVFYTAISGWERRVAVVVVAFILVLAAAVGPFGHAYAGESTAFLPAVTSISIVAMVLTAWLLFAQYRAGGSAPLALLGLAYGAAATLLVPFMLTFPRVFSPTGLLGAGPQSAAFLHLSWHAIFCAIIILYVSAERRAARGESQIAPRTAALVIGAVVAGIIALATFGHDSLPILIDEGRFTPLSRVVISPAFFVFVLIANAYLIFTTRLRTRSHLWLAVILFAMTVESFMSAFESSGRYSYGWYFARAETAIACTAFLMMLQSQYTWILRGLTLSYGRLQHRNAQVEAFVTLQEEISAVLPSREGVVAAVLHFAQAQTGGDGAALELLDANDIFYEAAIGTLGPHLEAKMRRPRFGSLSGLCAHSVRAMRTDDTLADDRVDRAACIRLNIRSAIVAPVVIAGEVTALLKVASRKTGAFADPDVTDLALITTILASGLRATQEYAVLQAAEREQRLYARQLRALHVIASTTTDDREEQIDDALRLGLEHLSLDWAYLGIIDSASNELVIERSVCRSGTPVLEAGVRVSLDEALVARVAVASGVVVVQDIEKENSQRNVRGWRSCIAVPLFIAGKHYGAIGFTSRDLPSEAFSQANVEFFSVAGELIASALERGIKKQQLAQSETRYRALTDAMPQLVWIIDAASTLRYVNARWADFTGLGVDRSAEFAGHAVIDSEYQSLLAAGRDVLPPEEFECEARVRRRDGVYRWHLVRAVPFEDVAGDLRKWIVTGTDIEERKLAEAAIGDLHATALAATEAKSRFLATMSHEIRTPMNGVIGMAELLLLTQLTSDQRDHAKVVYESGQSLLRILDDILDYSKIEAGKLDVEAVEFNLPEQISAVERLMRSQFERKGVTLTSRVAPNVPTRVIGDAGRLRQISINLVGNALKFTASGGFVHIAVSRETGSGEAGPVRFSVEDSGVGIAPEVVDRLFQPFTQGDGSTTRRFGGTGLGLSISSQLVALMNGTIGLESVPGKGSCFWFSIPFVESERRSGPLRLPQQPTEARSIKSRIARILLVEDNEINARVAMAQFKRIGFDISLAVNGKLAVEVVRNEDFDLIFMDCQMPEMDGFAAAREIRRIETTARQRRVPIVALTADARREDHTNCLAAGMDDYLSKPTNIGQLKAVVERWLPDLIDLPA